MNDGEKKKRVLGLYDAANSSIRQARDVHDATQEENWPQCPTCQTGLDRLCQRKSTEGESYQYVCPKCEFKEDEFVVGIL